MYKPDLADRFCINTNAKLKTITTKTALLKFCSNCLNVKNITSDKFKTITSSCYYILLITNSVRSGYCISELTFGYLLFVAWLALY